MASHALSSSNRPVVFVAGNEEKTIAILVYSSFKQVAKVCSSEFPYSIVAAPKSRWLYSDEE